MSGRPCPEGCRCGRHESYRRATPVPYSLTGKAVLALARWDAWERQREAEGACNGQAR